MLQTSSQNNTNHKSSFAFHRRLVSGGFAEQPCCTGKNYLCTTNISLFLPCNMAAVQNLYSALHIKQMSECVHQRLQNVVSTSVPLSYRLMCHFFYHILTSSTIYYWTDARQHGIYLLTTIGWGFCDIQNIQGRGRGYQPKAKAEVNNPYQDLDCSGYIRKTESNNSFIIANLEVVFLLLHWRQETHLIRLP